jgi:alcohol dehydrogenase class IV
MRSRWSYRLPRSVTVSILIQYVMRYGYQYTTSVYDHLVQRLPISTSHDLSGEKTCRWLLALKLPLMIVTATASKGQDMDE